MRVEAGVPGIEVMYSSMSIEVGLAHEDSIVGQMEQTKVGGP